MDPKTHKNTQELTAILNNSPNPIIKSLDNATKNSLIAYMEFENGRYVGMKDEADVNIDNLYKSGNAEQVFSAILRLPVMIHTSDNMPTVKDISLAEYVKIISVVTPAGVAVIGSKCENCKGTGPGHCCMVGGKGCIDYIILLPDKTFVRVK